ncbi:MAG TPA: glycosyltransferase family 2 protein [Gemmatimonadaceae bacterium]|jgi:GT2 family glycosyltransferase|nr:glycosyltransferase family 2 protein [Gemmatimonadaceae bacterium]
MSDIAVAVVSYNTREHLRRCLASVAAEGAPETVVVDNGSTDGSIEMLRNEFPDVILVVDESNPGYGGAANAAIARCRAPYVLLLNSDTELRHGALQVLRQYLDDHPRAGMVGPRLRNPDGTLQRSIHQFPSPLITLLDYSWVGWAVVRIPGVRALYSRSDPHDRARAVPWVVGAALAIRRSAFQDVGGFDPSYFMYFEEVDLSYRLRHAGWETHFAPVTDVIHAGGASTRQQRSRMLTQQMAAAMRFSERYQSWLSVHATRMALRFSLYSRVISDVVRYPFTRDPAHRERLVENIATARRALATVWARPTR